MIGYHAVPVIVDAYNKGIKDFDVKKAYQAIVHASTYDTINITFPSKQVKNILMPKVNSIMKQWIIFLLI